MGKIVNILGTHINNLQPNLMCRRMRVLHVAFDQRKFVGALVQWL
jgi:hypothetical protein